jgi:type III secretory pathway component EscR
MTMYTAALILAAAVMVPVGERTPDHAQPYHSGQPVVRRFERKSDDDTRRRGWESYIREIDLAWQDYRAAGKTEQAWQKYRRELAKARRDYIIGDIYYLPIESE